MTVKPEPNENANSQEFKLSLSFDLKLASRENKYRFWKIFIEALEEIPVHFIQ